MTHFQIIVSPEKKHWIELADPSIVGHFTTGDSEGFIRVVSKHLIQPQRFSYTHHLISISSLITWNRLKPTIGIMPSGFSPEWVKKTGIQSPYIFVYNLLEYHSDL
jgi:hypothetical protein